MWLIALQLLHLLGLIHDDHVVTAIVAVSHSLVRVLQGECISQLDLIYAVCGDLNCQRTQPPTPVVEHNRYGFKML